RSSAASGARQPVQGRAAGLEAGEGPRARGGRHVLRCGSRGGSGDGAALAGWKRNGGGPGGPARQAAAGLAAWRAEMIEIKRLQNVYMVAGDVPAATGFYEQVFGLRRKFADGERWVQYDAQGGSFAIGCPDEGVPGQSGAV